MILDRYFTLDPRDEVMPEQIHIGHHPDEILAQMRKDGHSRHCIGREIEEMEPIEVHNRLEGLGEGGTEATDEVSGEEPIRIRGIHLTRLINYGHPMPFLNG